MDIPNGLSQGERLRFARESAGMTRAVLAGLVGRSVSWLRKVEADERPLTSYTVLMRLAAALQLSDVSTLTGDETANLPVPLGRLSHPAMPDIWSAVMTRTLTPSAAEPVDATALQRDVDAAWSLWHRSGHNRTEVGVLLPALIRDGERGRREAEGTTRRRALVALSDVYRLVGQATAYVASPELAWVVADRAYAAAQEADDPAALAAAAWNLGNVIRETGHEEEALSVVTDAADLIRPHLDGAPDDWRGIYGALQLHASITLAREGKSGDAWRHWDSADHVSKSLPIGYVHPSTVFSRANVDAHAISVATDLRAAGQALTLADELDPDAMPSIERRARMWVEVARAHLQRNEQTAALHVMSRAHRIGPETVAYTPSARAATAELWRHAPRSLRPEATALAEAVGVAQPS